MGGPARAVAARRGEARLLCQLEDAAARLGVKVSYEAIGDEGPRMGAMGIWRGQRLLVVDRLLPSAGRIEILLRELGRLDLELIYLSPAVRELLIESRGADR